MKTAIILTATVAAMLPAWWAGRAAGRALVALAPTVELHAAWFGRHYSNECGRAVLQVGPVLLEWRTGSRCTCGCFCGADRSER